MQQIARATTALCFLLISSAAHAEAPVIFGKLKGEWIAKGNAFGAEATSRMKWSEAFGGKFYRIDYRIEMKRGEDKQVFEGAGHYRLGDGASVDAFWADSSGDLHPIIADASDAALVSHWGKAGMKQGRTEYRLNEDGSVLVTDWLLSAEGWKQFNQGTFKRK